MLENGNIFNIKEKVIIFTGGTGYLGAAITEYLEKSGAIVISFSRGIQKNESSYQLDISNDAKRLEIINLIGKKYKKIDAVINNAYSGKTNTILDTKREDFEESLEINLISPFLLIKDCLPLLQENSCIINIASMYGIVSPDPSIYGDSKQNNPVYYGAGKAGLIQMTKYLACHLVDKNIRVNAISPGAFPNFQSDQIDGDFHKNLIKKIPMKRIGKPNDLFGIIHFLISDASQYITGVNIPVDGGWTAW